MFNKIKSKSELWSVGRFSGLAGVVLVGVTLSVEAVLGGGCRWLIGFLLAIAVGMTGSVDLSPLVVGWCAAAAPLIWALCGLVVPGSGTVWARRLGARRASGSEQRVLDEALGLLSGYQLDLRRPRRFWVLDKPMPAAGVRGRSVVVTRSLVESEGLPAVLAHELWHVGTLDGRITEALKRVAMWGDPLGFEEDDGFCPTGPEGMAGFLWGVARWSLRLSGGSVSQRLLGPLWAPQLCAREYEADACAFRLGQGEDLLQYLRAYELAFDGPRPGLFDGAEHPPVALRIERLEELCGLGGRG